MAKTVRLLLASWTAGVPAEWCLEVKFAPADQEFAVWSGKLMALGGTLLRGSGPQVESLFTGMVKSGYAEYFEEVPAAPPAPAEIAEPAQPS